MLFYRFCVLFCPQQAALSTIGNLGRYGAPAMAQIVKCLDQSKLRSKAFYVIGELGPLASSALPKLTEFLSAKHSTRTRRKAIETLGRMQDKIKGHEKVLQNIIELSLEGDRVLRRAAKEAIAGFGDIALAEMEKMSKDQSKSKNLRKKIKRTLKHGYVNFIVLASVADPIRAFAPYIKLEFWNVKFKDIATINVAVEKMDAYLRFLYETPLAGNFYELRVKVLEDIPIQNIAKAIVFLCPQKKLKLEIKMQNSAKIIFRKK